VKVTSPIGELPFTVRRVRTGGEGLVVEGELGAWRSEIEIGPGDVPMLARALRGPLIALGVGFVLVALTRRR
jgi:hypothetical protein